MPKLKPLRGRLLMAATFVAVTALVYICKPIYDARVVTKRIEALNGAVMNETVVPSLMKGLAFAPGGRAPLVKDDDIHSLIPYLHSLRIEYVGLASTAVTDDGAVALIETLKSSLMRLDVSGTRITERTLLAAAECPGLTSVAVPAAALTSKAIKALSNSVSLQSVYIYSPDGGDDLKLEAARSLPRAYVELRRMQHADDDHQGDKGDAAQ